MCEGNGKRDSDGGGNALAVAGADGHTVTDDNEGSADASKFSEKKKGRMYLWLISVFLVPSVITKPISSSINLMSLKIPHSLLMIFSTTKSRCHCKIWHISRRNLTSLTHMQT